MQINKRFDLLKKLTMSGRPRRPILAVRAGRKPSPDDRAFPQPNLQDEEGDNNDLLDREFENSIHYFLRKLGRFLKSNWKIFLYAVVCIFLGQFMFERKCEKTEVEQNSQVLTRVTLYAGIHVLFQFFICSYLLNFQCFLAIEKNLSWREAIYSYESSLTEAQIRFEGQKCMYLAIAGHVFDVSSAKQTYQRGSDYNAFIGIIL